MQFGGGEGSRKNLGNWDQAHEILYHLGLEFFVKLECAIGIVITRQVHKPCCGLLWRSINKFYSEITVFCPAFLHSHWSWGEAELCKSILGSIYAKQPGFRAFVARVWLIQSHLIRGGGGHKCYSCGSEWSALVARDKHGMCIFSLCTCQHLLIHSQRAVCTCSAYFGDAWPD